MTERMTDERLAEIEATHAEVEPLVRPHPRPRSSIRPLDISDPWFYWEEMPGLTTQQTHQQRGELLQALKAERESHAEATEAALGRERELQNLREGVERLRRNDELQMNRAIAAERKLERLVDGLKQALHDRCIGIRHHHDQLAVPIGQRQFEARLYNLINEATGEGK